MGLHRRVHSFSVFKVLCMKYLTEHQAARRAQLMHTPATHAILQCKIRLSSQGYVDLTGSNPTVFRTKTTVMAHLYVRVHGFIEA